MTVSKGRGVLALIDHLRQLRREQDALLNELQGVAELMVQGVDPAQVRAYDFHPDDCPKNEPAKGQFLSELHYGQAHDRYSSRVILKDGTVVKLNPILRNRTRRPT